jgi:hypothetical protein
MSRESVLASGRRAAERGMTDQCVIKRVTGRSTDPNTGVVTTTTTTLYTGKCRIQAWSRLGVPAAVPEVVGAQYERLLRIELQLPIVGTEGLQDGDVLTITSAAHDADLVGRTLVVHDPSIKSEATSRRCGAIEVF